MKIIKRLISVTMVCVMLISVTACGGYDNKDYERYLNTVASGLKAANNLITVNPVYIEAQDIIDTLYTETVRNNNAPDVYLMSAENSDKAYLLGLMLENDSYGDIYNEKIYGKAAIKSASYKGKCYGI